MNDVTTLPSVCIHVAYNFYLLVGKMMLHGGHVMQLCYFYNTCTRY